VGTTFASAPELLAGRVVETTLQELTGDTTKGYVKLRFRIVRAEDGKAWAAFVGHELASEYVKRLIRKRRSKVEVITDVATKDACKFRVKAVAITKARVQTTKKTALHNRIRELLEAGARARNLPEFVHDMLSGRLSAHIFVQCKPIYPLRRLEIRRSEVGFVASSELPAPPPEEETQKTATEEKEAEGQAEKKEAEK
jgi:small subunit ribosomal protein S3Ae